jgi:hypothetical protein
MVDMGWLLSPGLNNAAAAAAAAGIAGAPARRSRYRGWHGYCQERILPPLPLLLPVGSGGTW